MRSLFRISLPFLLSACLAVSAFAQTVRTFVSTAGSDSNPCSRTLPCRNFAPAIAAVNNGGEVVVLDSGGYGPVTIDKSVTLVTPSGVYAAIAPTSGDAVTVNTPGIAVVALRGLSLNGMGGTYGIRIIQVGGLHVEGCLISNFSASGVLVSGPGDLMMLDTIVRGNGTYALHVGASPVDVVNAVLDRVRIMRNGQGILFTGLNTTSTVRDCLVTLSTNADGILIQSSQVNIENCVVADNVGSGIAVGFSGTVRVSNTMSVNNLGAGFARSTGTFLSWGNNRVRGNFVDKEGTITVVGQD